MQATYRPAIPADVPQIVEVVSRMVEGTKFAPPTEQKIMRFITGDYYNEGIWFEGQLIAFMAGRVSETFLNNEINAYEMGVFVLPEYRGTRHSVRLIRHFEEWARSRGAANVWLGQSVGQRKNETLHFFERLGYECQGFITCKKL